MAFRCKTDIAGDRSSRDGGPRQGGWRERVVSVDLDYEVVGKNIGVLMVSAPGAAVELD